MKPEPSLPRAQQPALLRHFSTTHLILSHPHLEKMKGDIQQCNSAWEARKEETVTRTLLLEGRITLRCV